LLQVLAYFFKDKKSLIYQTISCFIEIIFQDVNKKQQLLKFIFDATIPLFIHQTHLRQQGP
jgi:hypothetical protein